MTAGVGGWGGGSDVQQQGFCFILSPNKTLGMNSRSVRINNILFYMHSVIYLYISSFNLFMYSLICSYSICSFIHLFFVVYHSTVMILEKERDHEQKT